MSTTQNTTAEATSRTVDATLAKVGTSMSIGGGSGAVIGSFTLNELAMIVGMLTGILGLAVQWYYKHRLTKAELQRLAQQAELERAEHEARMGLYR